MRGELQAYGDWLAGCDATPSCTLIGVPAPLHALDADGPPSTDMAVRIEALGAVDRAPVVELIPLRAAPPADGLRGAGACRLRLGTKAVADLADVPCDRAVLTGAAAERLLQALSEGAKVTGVVPGQPAQVFRFPAQGSAQALQAMQRRRAAFARRGASPDGPVPHRLPARELMVSGFSPIFAANRCGAQAMRAMRHFRFANGTEMWSHQCTEADPARTWWVMNRDPLATGTPIDLPEPRGGPIAAGRDGLENAIFDWDFGVLRSYVHVKGHEDCGVMRAWGFTAQGWRLLERREMPLCRGLAPSDWIRTHFEPTGGSGPDE
ncbi:MAG: DUF1176 domain-containing protein [Novosphingobium sp.]